MGRAAFLLTAATAAMKAATEHLVAGHRPRTERIARARRALRAATEALAAAAAELDIATDPGDLAGLVNELEARRLGDRSQRDT